MSKKKILIIDDEQDFCEVVKMNLEDTGQFEVATSTDARAGINLAKEIKPDFILLDFVLLDVDGLNLCKEIKSSDETKDSHVIITTGKHIAKNSGIMQDAFKQSGADDFLPKPFEVPQLLEKINALT